MGYVLSRCQWSIVERGRQHRISSVDRSEAKLSEILVRDFL